MQWEAERFRRKLCATDPSEFGRGGRRSIEKGNAALSGKLFSGLYPNRSPKKLTASPFRARVSKNGLSELVESMSANGGNESPCSSDTRPRLVPQPPPPAVTLNSFSPALIRLPKSSSPIGASLHLSRGVTAAQTSSLVEFVS